MLYHGNCTCELVSSSNTDVNSVTSFEYLSAYVVLTEYLSAYVVLTEYLSAYVVLTRAAPAVASTGPFR
jgi:hypothetical protein